MANKRLSIGAILAHSHPFHFSFSPTHRMEEKDRGGGGPIWTDPTFGPPSGSRRLDEWKRRAVPNSSRESRDRRRDRSDRSAGRKSSRSERRRRYQNPSDSDEDSRPPDGVKREVLAGLGGTSGVTSAGAWSARLEIANLLEVGVSPEHVIDMVRKGKEADFPLGSNGGLKLVWVDRHGKICKPAKRKAFSPAPLSSDREDEKSVATSMGGDSELGGSLSRKSTKTEALGVGSSLPPWVESQGGHKGEFTPQRAASEKMEIPPVSGFSKPAKPPKHSQLPSARDAEKKEAPLGDDTFRKRAPPPREGFTPVKEIPVISSKTRIQPRSVAEKEVQDLKKFQEFALHFFGFLRLEGVEMDLLELVTKPDGGVNEDRFSLHTSPNRASTGLRYARLMKGLVDWLKEDERERPKDKSIFNRLCLLEYVEWKVQDGCGAHTPKSILLAFDFFSKTFGFEAHGGHFGRAKRLSERVAKNPVKGRVGAPLFSREFLGILEDLVLDPFLPHPQRIAAGKLRLCIQSSTRYDDIANTPLSHCEWVRRPGELDIVALRSRSIRGKSGARLWIASVMGVTESGDKWLSTLVGLLLTMHGARWKTDDHIGKLPTRDGRGHYDSPSRMEADVYVLKSALINSGSIGPKAGLGVSEDDVLGMRWHGAKATLVTVMQHLKRPCKSGQVCWLLELSPGVDGGPVLAGGSVVDIGCPREGFEVLEDRGKCSRTGRRRPLELSF